MQVFEEGSWFRLRVFEAPKVEMDLGLATPGSRERSVECGEKLGDELDVTKPPT